MSSFVSWLFPVLLLASITPSYALDARNPDPLSVMLAAFAAQNGWQYRRRDGEGAQHLAIRCTPALPQSGEGDRRVIGSGDLLNRWGNIAS